LASDPVRVPVFECMQCGDCCRNLFKSAPGTDNCRLGLTLTPTEADSFRELGAQVIEQIGVGRRGNRRPRPASIIRYQLTTETCPFLTQSRCRIYSRRPITCRMYPLTGTTTRDTSCSFAKDHPDFLATDEMTEDASRFVMLTAQRIGGARNELFFKDVTRRAWIQVDRRAPTP
jgi:Fe-S-cluster containining protein